MGLTSPQVVVACRTPRCEQQDTEQTVIAGHMLSAQVFSPYTFNCLSCGFGMEVVGPVDDSGS